MTRPAPPKPTRPDPGISEVKGAADAAPVMGELLELQAVDPSAGQLRSDARGRIGNTAVQVGIPAAIVGIGSWLARLNGIDLDPGTGIDLPADVAGYFVAVLTVLFAFKMNRRHL